MDELDHVSAGGLAAATPRVGAKCGRWNPTAEQVKVLTDLFAAGLRTPTTEQIQMISSHLGSFGKIESKNVFYWFQNHKARERHHKKRRRGSAPRDFDHLSITNTATPKPTTLPDKKEATRDQQEVIWERGSSRGREMETLELFPLSSYNNKALERDQKWSEMSRKDPPLDLRLSFL